MKINLLVAMFLLMFVVGCVSTHEKHTLRTEYPEMYSAQPKTILVLPAINKSTAADAGDYYATTIAEPLSQKGYYVLPIPITNAIMKQEGIVDGAQLSETNLSLFKNTFGADAVLFVTIERWDTDYSIVSGNVTVGISFQLKSALTFDVLWHYENTVVVNTTENHSNSDWLAAIIVTAIKTAMQDYVPVAQDVNRGAMSKMPVGPYHHQYGLD